jgi:hypothetical protein
VGCTEVGCTIRVEGCSIPHMQRCFGRDVLLFSLLLAYWSVLLGCVWAKCVS